MQRVTISLDEELASEIDQFARQRGYQSRSEVIRDLTRRGIRQAAEESDSEGECVAALVYVYDHEARDLARRLTRAFHDHHDLSVSALHVHLDHDACLEVNVLRGPATAIRHLSEHVIAERGVRHGRVVMIPAELSEKSHSHGAAGRRRHLHTHVRRAG